MWVYGIGLAAIIAAVSGQSAEFSTLIDDYWQWRLKDAPEFASSMDVTTYNDRAEQYSIKVLDERKYKVDEYRQRLEQVKRADLTAIEQTSYDVLKDTLDLYIAGYKWKNYGPMNPVNFLEGPWTDESYYIPDPLETYADFMAYITRVYELGDQALYMIKRMRRAINESTTDNWVSIKSAVPTITKMIGNSDMDSPFYKPLNETLDNTTMPEQNKTALRALAISTLMKFREKFQTLNQFIETEYKNYTREAYGVNSFRDGEAYYKACLKWHLSVDITPEEVHNKGLAEVERIYKEMRKVMVRLKANGTIKEFFDSVKANPKFIINSSEEVVQRYQSIIDDRVRPKLSRYFQNIPDKPVKVEPLPYDGPGGMYAMGSPNGKRPGIFYVNVFRPKDNPIPDMVALTLHEADPGHHLQDIYAQASSGLPLFRRYIDFTKYFSVPLHFPFYTAYAEGWALYAESLGEKEHLDIYQDDYELMGRYSSEIFRACRLVVDTGLHHFNWTRDEAIEYMMNYTSYTQEALTIEIDRYITWPGQACAYKIGELKIKELRTRAENKLGPKFDMREFHSVILDDGAVPLTVLEQLIDEWIEIAGDSFAAITVDFFAWRQQMAPEFASSTTNKYDDKLESYEYSKFASWKNEAQSFLKRLRRIQKTSLTPEKRVSYDVLENMLQTYVDGYIWKDYEPLNPIVFIEGYINDLSRFVPSTFNTQGYFVNYVRRVELMPKQLDEMMNLSRMAIANGHTNNNVSVSRLPDQIDNVIKADISQSTLYQPYIEYAASLFDGDTIHIKARLRTAIEACQRKLSEVKTFLITEYMPATRPGLGIGTLPGGKDNYRACLKWHTSLDISPEEVHQKGLDEVTRIAGLMREKMTAQNYSTNWTIGEVYSDMLRDKRFLLDTKKATLERFKEIVFQRIQPQLSKYFLDPPMLPLRVQASVTDGIGGEYMTGSADGSTPGVFYANVHRPEYNPTFKMVSLSLHEALPGHHLQDSYSLTSDLPDFRKYTEWKSYNVPFFFPFYNAYVEGWGLYSEYLGEEMGIYQNDFELLGRYSDEMLRACRLVIDTGIHHYNWTRQSAIDYMLSYTAETPDSAATEIDRYATWPGQACGYKMGELKLKELKNKAETELGDRFDIRNYHEVVLRNGAVPLDILEQLVTDWIKVTKDSDPATVSLSPVCPRVTSAAGAPTATLITVVAAYLIVVLTV